MLPTHTRPGRTRRPRPGWTSGRRSQGSGAPPLAHLLAGVPQRQGQLGGHGALPHAALPGEHQHDVPHAGQVALLWGEEERRDGGVRGSSAGPRALKERRRAGAGRARRGPGPRAGPGGCGAGSQGLAPMTSALRQRGHERPRGPATAGRGPGVSSAPRRFLPGPVTAGARGTQPRHRGQLRRRQPLRARRHGARGEHGAAHPRLHRG